jgi:hypothetical protein
VSVVSLLIPLYPIIPPGLLFTVLSRRLAWESRTLRAYSDIARLPLCYLAPPDGKGSLRKKCEISNGEQYSFISGSDLLPLVQTGTVPLLLPKPAKAKADITWHLFGSLQPGDELPSRPKDPFATFGILPGDPRQLSCKFMHKAYLLEAVTWILLLAGIGLNIFFFFGIILVLL